LTAGWIGHANNSPVRSGKSRSSCNGFIGSSSTLDSSNANESASQA